MNTHEGSQLYVRPHGRCVQAWHADMLYSVSVLARGPVILADSIVIAATWMTLRHQVIQTFDLGLKLRTSTVVLADGTSSSTVTDVAKMT